MTAVSEPAKARSRGNSRLCHIPVDPTRRRFTARGEYHCSAAAADVNQSPQAPRQGLSLGLVRVRSLRCGQVLCIAATCWVRTR